MTGPDGTTGACPRCGTAIEPDHRFCLHCGTELSRVDRPEPARQRRRWRLWGMVALVVVGVAGVITVVVSLTTSNGGRADLPQGPQDTAAVWSDQGWPGAEGASAAETITYLGGEGRILEEFYESTDVLFAIVESGDSDPGERCRRVATELDSIGSSRDLLDVAGAIPDEVLARLTLNAHAARSAAVVHCVRGDIAAMREDITGASRLQELVDQRHAELEDAGR